MPFALLLALFVIVPIAELYIIIAVVGEAIGAPLTLLALVVDSLLGAALLRSQGRAVWRRFTDALAAGQVPHREIVDGVLVIFGGAFLLTPGFLTDIVGLMLLLPPTRSLVRAALARRIERRVRFGADPRTRSPYDVDQSTTVLRDQAGRARGQWLDR